MLSLALQLNVPPPVLLMLKVCVEGLLPPCWAAKERLFGLVPIAGLVETAGAEGGEINCANRGISAASLRIVRPPPPFSDLDELPPPAEARGTVPVDAVPAGVEFVDDVDDGGATLIVAKGMADPTLLLSNDGSLGSNVVLSFCVACGVVGNGLTGRELDRTGSRVAMGALSGFRISRCGLRAPICASFFSRDCVGSGRGAVLLVSWLRDPVSCWADAEEMGCNSDVMVVAKPHRITMVVKRGCRIAWRMVWVLRISLSATSRIHEADFMHGPHVGVDGDPTVSLFSLIVGYVSPVGSLSKSNALVRTCDQWAPAFQFTASKQWFELYGCLRAR